MRVRGVMRDRIVIPVSELKGFDPEDVVKGFSVDSYDDYACSKCPLVKKRRHPDCIPCENYKGRAFLARKRRDHKGKLTHLSFPLGAHSEIERRLDVTLDLRDERDFSRRELKRPLKLIRDLYDGSPAPDGTTRINQYEVKDKWLEHYMGVIHASARSGKTVLAAAITCEVGMRTLVVTDRVDLLIQFRETFVGGERRVRMTNAKPERVILIKKMSDFDKPHDVALISYQKMIRETGPSLILKHVKGKYGLLVVDECLPEDAMVTTTAGRVSIDTICRDPSRYVVLSHNHVTGQDEWKAVVSGSQTLPKQQMVEITHENGVFRCTPEHPVWSETRQAYVPACEITPEDVLRLTDV